MSTQLGDAMVIGQAKIERRDCELAVMDFRFMGGSMGSAVGEKFARACDRAADRSIPLVCVPASGGARMQEGILSLMQLPKTVCAVETLREALLPVPRRDDPPDDGRRAGELRQSGRRDSRRAGRAALVHRAPGRPADRAREASRGLRSDGVQLPVRPYRSHRVAHRPAARASAGCWRSSPMASDEQVPASDPHGAAAAPGASGEAERAPAAVSRRRRLRRARAPQAPDRPHRRSEPTEDEIWDVVELARHDKRPYTLDYVERIFDDFFELHGDR